MSEIKPKYSVVDDAVFNALLEVMTPEQILSIVEDLQHLKKIGHGEIIITVKNCEVYFIDKRTSRDVRRQEIKDKQNSALEF